MICVAAGNSKSKDGIDIPGGLIRIDIYRGKRPFVIWLEAIGLMFLRGGLTNRGVKRDIVIYDVDQTRELYREGPFDGITVNRRISSLLSEIQRTGLREFVRAKQVESSQLGPVSEPSGRFSSLELEVGWIAAIIGSWRHRLRGKR
jgi:hypothetical protein